MEREYINLTLDNVDSEHLCCAISDKKHQCGVDAKRDCGKFETVHLLNEGYLKKILNR